MWHLRSVLTTPTPRYKILVRACSQYKDDLLSRTREIFDAAEASKVVQGIRPGSVIGLDVEGHHQIQVLQLRDEHKNVHIFRLSSNPALLTHLAPILEDPDITKVIHQSVKDVFSLYRQGVRLWGLFDTCIAHKVFLYQAYGDSLVSKNMISYQNLCQYHGYEVPLGSPKERPNQLNGSEDPLPEDYLLYCATDVDHLLDLHMVISSLLDADYKRLERQLSESEILRVLDPEFGPVLSERQRSLEKNDLFLKNISVQMANPFYIYEFLEKIPGRKKILYSSTYGTAHILFEKRSSAIKSLFQIEKEATREGDPLSRLKGTETSLLIPLKLTSNQNTDPVSISESLVPQLVSILSVIENLPLVCDFGTYCHGGDDLFLDLFIYSEQPIRINLSPTAVEHLRPLFESHSITKIIFNMSVSESAKGIQLLRKHRIESKQMMDVMTTFKLYLYSKFQANPFSLNFISRKEFFRHLGLEESKNRLESTLFAYAHLAYKLLHPRILDFVGALSKLDYDIISSPENESPRVVKGQLKKKLIHESVAISCSNEVEVDFMNKLRKILTPLSSHTITLISDSVALVEFPKSHSIVPEIGPLLPKGTTIIPWNKNYYHQKNAIPSVHLSDLEHQLRTLHQGLSSQSLKSILDEGRNDVIESQENISRDVYL